MLSANKDSMSCRMSGFSFMSSRTLGNPSETPVLPSTRYDAKVNGRPTKPSSVVSGDDLANLRLNSLKTDPTKWHFPPKSALDTRWSRLFNSSLVRTGAIRIFPPSDISKSIPIAGSGVNISEKRMTPSIPSIGLHVSTSLPHHPNRRSFYRLPTRRSQQQGFIAGRRRGCRRVRCQHQ
mmetsp:Transcript_664/g.1396  ORF Transcript_664/g.1396 Transcript_664/m.1396 type:complete len:179 (+) Transcript_664:776-1312(+)